MIGSLSSENIGDNTTVKLNEVMTHFIRKINHQNDKVKKIKHIFDFYTFIDKSCYVILVPQYRKFVETVVCKTQCYMKILEEKYFPEMITTQEKIAIIDCYYMLSTVKNKFKKYLTTLDHSTFPALLTCSTTI
jgi:hypothetical protein